MNPPQRIRCYIYHMLAGKMKIVKVLVVADTNVRTLLNASPLGAKYKAMPTGIQHTLEQQHKRILLLVITDQPTAKKVWHAPCQHC